MMAVPLFTAHNSVVIGRVDESINDCTDAMHRVSTELQLNRVLQ